jgi:hypothetical protein
MVTKKPQGITGWAPFMSPPAMRLQELQVPDRTYYGCLETL